MFGSIRQFVPWIITSIVSLLLIVTSSSPQTISLRRGFSDIVLLAASPLSPLLKAPRIWQENRRLRSTLANMSLEIARLSEHSAESERLRQMLEFKADAEFELIAAEVIGYNPHLGIRTIFVDKGEVDGISKNLSAIVPDGLVGRVYQVERHSSAIQLIIDSNIGVAARIVRLREDGILHANIDGSLVFKGVPATSQVIPGDTLVTSGLGGIFPSNIFIGWVEEVTPDPDGWLLNIMIEPGVDFRRIDEVFVVSGALNDR